MVIRVNKSTIKIQAWHSILPITDRSVGRSTAGKSVWSRFASYHLFSICRTPPWSDRGRGEQEEAVLLSSVECVCWKVMTLIETCNWILRGQYRMQCRWWHTISGIWTERKRGTVIGRTLEEMKRRSRMAGSSRSGVSTVCKGFLRLSSSQALQGLFVISWIKEWLLISDSNAGVSWFVLFLLLWEASEHE